MGNTKVTLLATFSRLLDGGVSEAVEGFARLCEAHFLVAVAVASGAVVRFPYGAKSIIIDTAFEHTFAIPAVTAIKPTWIGTRWLAECLPFCVLTDLKVILGELLFLSVSFLV